MLLVRNDGGGAHWRSACSGDGAWSQGPLRASRQQPLFHQDWPRPPHCHDPAIAPNRPSTFCPRPAAPARTALTPPSLAPFLFDQPGLPLLAVQLSPHPFNIPSSPSSSPLLFFPLLFIPLYSTPLSILLLSFNSPSELFVLPAFWPQTLFCSPSSACGWTLP